MPQKLITPKRKAYLREYRKNYSITHRNELKEYRSQWRKDDKRKHPEKYALIAKLARAKYKTRDRERHRIRMATDLNYRLANYLRSRVRYALKNGQKSGSAVADLGCSISDFRSHIESRFQPGMSWSNWGMHGWHLDHITPLVSFNLEERPQFLIATHYTNMQPLWASDNLRKGHRLYPLL